MSPAVISVAVTLVALALVVAVVALTGGGPLRAGGRRALPVPVPWLVAGAALVLVGVVVMPRLLGFMFLLLPMIWSRAARGSRGPHGPGGPGGGPGGPGPGRERDPFDEDR